MIRDYTIEDINKINELGKDLKDTFDISTLNDNENIIVYTLNNQVIAFLEYSILYETIDILNIVVDKPYRKKGIGKSLLDYLITNNKEINHLMLEVRETNINAINFYEKNDFKVIRTIKNYYDSEDGYAMERSLL